MEWDRRFRSISRSQKSANFLRGLRLYALGPGKSWNSVLFYPKKELRAPGMLGWPGCTTRRIFGGIF